MAASGVNHNPQISILILLEFDKMVAAAQRTDLVKGILHQRKQRFILLIIGGVFQTPVQNLRFLSLLI